MNLEGFKEIKTAPDYYINKDGVIISMKGKSPHKMSIQQDKDGYNTCSVYVNGKRKVIKRYRVLAEAFIPNPDNLPCIDHIDRKRSNDNLENLRWCTYKENANNRTYKPHYKRRRRLYRVENGWYVIYPSVNHACAEGYNYAWHVAKGYCKHSKGKIFSFEPPNF